MFYAVHNQLTLYTNALPDVLKYVVTALSTTAYVEPESTASRHILHRQLFEQLKTKM